MADIPTLQDLQNADIDMETLASFANDPAGNVIPRYGVSYPNLRQLAANASFSAMGITTVANISARDTFFAITDNQDKLVYVNNNNGAADDPANGVYEYVSGAARIAEGFYQGLSVIMQDYTDKAIEAGQSSLGNILNDCVSHDNPNHGGAVFSGNIVTVPTGYNGYQFQFLRQYTVDPTIDVGKTLKIKVGLKQLTDYSRTLKGQFIEVLAQGGNRFTGLAISPVVDGDNMTFTFGDYVIASDIIGIIPEIINMSTDNVTIDEKVEIVSQVIGFVDTNEAGLNAGDENVTRLRQILENESGVEIAKNNTTVNNYAKKLIFSGGVVSVTAIDAETAEVNITGGGGTDPTNSIVGDGIGSPLSNASYAAGAAGVLTGAYGYNVTFVTALGETCPWTGTPVQVTLDGKQMNLTNIPIGPAGVIARKIYRSKANSGEPKNTNFLVEIADNTTTTYTDNTPDASLGAPVSWTAANYGYISTADGVVANFGNSGSVSLGALAKVGYAGVSIGGQAGAGNIAGFRNVGIGGYALTACTFGVENTAVGTHAGAGLVAGSGNVAIGCYSGLGPAGGGSYTIGTQNYNTLVGHGIASNGTGLGAGNVGIGYHALYNINSADQCIAIGYFAGGNANASRQVFIDPIARATLAAEQDQGLIYGQAQNAAQTQELRFNARVRLGWGGAAVAQLPAATAALKGFRAFVIDATVAYLGINIGSTVTGGGAFCVPVFCDGTNWVIG